LLPLNAATCMSQYPIEIVVFSWRQKYPTANGLLSTSIVDWAVSRTRRHSWPANEQKQVLRRSSGLRAEVCVPCSPGQSAQVRVSVLNKGATSRNLFVRIQGGRINKKINAGSDRRQDGGKIGAWLACCRVDSRPGDACFCLSFGISAVGLVELPEEAFVKSCPSAQSLTPDKSQLLAAVDPGGVVLYHLDGTQDVPASQPTGWKVCPGRRASSWFSFTSRSSISSSVQIPSSSPVTL
jgi:hypothetical protein